MNRTDTFLPRTAYFVFLAGVALLLPLPSARAQSSADLEALMGDTENGKMLYDIEFRCYACHGFTGETGNPRLKPMAFSQAGFISFLRNPPRPAGAGGGPGGRMPAYASDDISDQMLADVYAYIRSMPENSPPLEAIPLLSDN